MNGASIHEQLAERMAIIQRKHERPGTKAPSPPQASFLPATMPPRPNVPDNKALAATPADLRLTLAGSQTTPPRCGLLPTGLPEIDEALAGGLRAGVHEWYGANERHAGTQVRRHEEATQPNRQSTIDHRPSVPLCLLVHLAWQALKAAPSRWVIWVGRNCFPYPAVLVRDAGRDLRLLRRSLFVRADTAADRVWVADLSIRGGLAGAVIADGAALDMAATRRLQLSARSHGTFVFLARLPQDLDRLSAATTRWLVRAGGVARPNAATPALAGAESGYAPHRDSALTPAPLPGGEGKRRPPTPNPQWSLELLRCKGMQPSTSRRVWLVEWNRAANAIGVHTPLCDLLDEEARSHSPPSLSRHVAT